MHTQNEQDPRKIYVVKWTSPRPSMWLNKGKLRASSYQEAVDFCHELWRAFARENDHRTVTLHSELHMHRAWHVIERDGTAQDRNTNSDVQFIINERQDGVRDRDRDNVIETLVELW